MPLRSTAATVPAPPWWTAHAHCGKSHSCGSEPLQKSTRCAAYSRSAPGGRLAAEMSAQPPSTIARAPAAIAASTANRAISSAVPGTIDPQPK